MSEFHFVPSAKTSRVSRPPEANYLCRYSVSWPWGRYYEEVLAGAEGGVTVFSKELGANCVRQTGI